MFSEIPRNTRASCRAILLCLHLKGPNDISSSPTDIESKNGRLTGLHAPRTKTRLEGRRIILYIHRKLFKCLYLAGVFLTFVYPRVCVWPVNTNKQSCKVLTTRSVGGQLWTSFFGCHGLVRPLLNKQSVQNTWEYLKTNIFVCACVCVCVHWMWFLFFPFLWSMRLITVVFVDFYFTSVVVPSSKYSIYQTFYCKSP